MAELPEINTALLTQEQQQELDDWLEMFASPGWRRFTERFLPLIQSYSLGYNKAIGAQQLGNLQGRIAMLAMMVVNLPSAIRLEALAATGQIGNEDDEDRPDDLVSFDNPMV